MKSNDNSKPASTDVLRAAFDDETTTVEWRYLVPHALREALLIVSASVPLVDVAIALAQDDAASLKEWLDAALVARPKQADLNVGADDTYIFLIVAPFVVAQRVATESAVRN